MPTIIVMRNLDSETLHLPELRPLVGHRVEIVVRDSEPSRELDEARVVLLQTLHETWNKCQQPNWDGEGADDLSVKTLEVARRFVESMPSDLPLPTVAAEPDGHLNFEWYQTPRRLISASVSPTGTVHWAALIGSEDPRGSCQFSDQFPQTLVYWIRQVHG